MLLQISPSERATQVLQNVTRASPHRIETGPPLIRPSERSCANVDHVPSTQNANASMLQILNLRARTSSWPNSARSLASCVVWSVGLRVASVSTSIITGGRVGNGDEGVFRVVTLRSFPDKVIDVAVKAKLLSPGCILYAPSEDGILDPRMGSLEQFEELNIPHPHYSRDPGVVVFFRGTSASVAIERGMSTGYSPSVAHIVNPKLGSILHN